MIPALEHPDLFALLRGELDNAEVLAAGEHLRGCPDCHEDLADAVTAHALLSRTARVLGPDSVDAPIPALRPVAQPKRRSARRRTGRRRPALLVAAAAVAAVAVLAVGIGLGGALGDDDETGDNSALPGQATPTTPTTTPPPTTSPVGLSAPLVAVVGRGEGEVQMVDDDDLTRMTIQTQGLRPLRAGEFYYAWLLDPATNKMLPLGQVKADGSSSYELTDALLGAYSTVDVSLEADDGNPAHSVTSVLRGNYT